MNNSNVFRNNPKTMRPGTTTSSVATHRLNTDVLTAERCDIINARLIRESRKGKCFKNRLPLEQKSVVQHVVYSIR